MARFRPVSKIKGTSTQKNINQSRVNFSGSHNNGSRRVSALSVRIQQMILALTGNLTFPTLPITLIQLGSDSDALTAAIAAMGKKGNRGSKIQQVTLQTAAATVEQDIMITSAYVNQVANTTFPGATKLQRQVTILSSGLPTKLGGFNAKAQHQSLVDARRQPAAPSDFIQHYSKKTVVGQVRLKWKKVAGAVAYRVKRRDMAGLFTYYTCTTASFVATGLTVGSKYSWDVVAIGRYGQQSAPSQNIDTYPAPTNA